MYGRALEVETRRLDLRLVGSNIGISPEGVDNLLAEVGDEIERLKGLESVFRFIRSVLPLTSLVAVSLTKPNSYDDSFFAADVWTTVITSEGRFKLLPVQVKSSSYFLDRFVEQNEGWDRLKQLGLVVVNAGIAIKDSAIKTSYLKQVRGIGILNRWNLLKEGRYLVMRNGSKVSR